MDLRDGTGNTSHYQNDNQNILPYTRLHQECGSVYRIEYGTYLCIRNMCPYTGGIRNIFPHWPKEGSQTLYIFHLRKQLRPNTVREPCRCSGTLDPVLPRVTVQDSSEKRAPHSAPRIFTGTERKGAQSKQYADETVLTLRIRNCTWNIFPPLSPALYLLVN